jgi:hypothetical protein
MQRFKPVALVIGALFVTGALTGTAAAVLTSDSGGAEVRVDKRTENAPFWTSSPNFIDVPGMNVVVSVPANQSRLYDVPYFAESQCDGPMSGICSIQIIATNLATGQSVELNPQAGIDYAFDSDPAGAATVDFQEGHGMERSRRLSGGDNGTQYRIRVQAAVTNPNTTFRLDEQHLAVHTNL